MRRQRGVIATIWLVTAGGIALTILGLGIAVKVQTSRLEAVKAEYSNFKAQTIAEGVAAEKARLQDIKNRETISNRKEADHVKRFATQDARYRAAVAAARLSSTNSGSGEAKPLSSASTILSCPDRQPDAARGLEQLEIGVLSLLERGDKAIERTITCKAWIDEQVAKP